MHPVCADGVSTVHLFCGLGLGTNPSPPGPIQPCTAERGEGNADHTGSHTVWDSWRGETANIQCLPVLVVLPPTVQPGMFCGAPIVVRGNFEVLYAKMLRSHQSTVATFVFFAIYVCA